MGYQQEIARTTFLAHTVSLYSVCQKSSQEMMFTHNIFWQSHSV